MLGAVEIAQIPGRVNTRAAGRTLKFKEQDREQERERETERDEEGQSEGERSPRPLRSPCPSALPSSRVITQHDMQNDSANKAPQPGHSKLLFARLTQRRCLLQVSARSRSVPCHVLLQPVATEHRSQTPLGESSSPTQKMRVPPALGCLLVSCIASTIWRATMARADERTEAMELRQVAAAG